MVRETEEALKAAALTAAVCGAAHAGEGVVLLVLEEGARPAKGVAAHPVTAGRRKELCWCACWDADWCCQSWYVHTKCHLLLLLLVQRESPGMQAAAKLLTWAHSVGRAPARGQNHQTHKLHKLQHLLLLHCCWSPSSCLPNQSKEEL